MTLTAVIPAAVRSLGADLLADPDGLARLYRRPPHECGNTCWLTPRRQVSVNGDLVPTRYYVFEWVTGIDLPRTETLVAGPMCGGLKDCVNPLHQIRLTGSRRGRKPVTGHPAPVTEHRALKIYQMGVEGLPNWTELLLLPAKQWPAAARDDCWLWTGHLHALNQRTHLPYIGNRTAMQVVWETYHRQPIPDGKKVKRVCRNQMCINPLHLALANAKLRQQDEHVAPTDHPSPPSVEPHFDASEDRELLLDLVNNSYPDRPPTEWLGPFTRMLLDEFVPRHVRALLRDLAQDDRQYRELLEHIRWS